VDRAAFPRDKPCAEYLSPAAEPLLTDLGVMGQLETTRPARLRGFRIFAPSGGMIQGDFAATRDAKGRSLFETGLAIPRLRLDATLVEAARVAGAELYMNWRLAQLARKEGVWRLEPVGESERISARLLLAADGVHSTVARRLGLHETSRMRKVALVAHMRGIGGMGEYGEMHVAGRRYVGIAPLEPTNVGDLCNVAMVVDEARDGRNLAGRPERFLQEALKTFPKLAGRLDQVTVTRRTLAISRITVRAKRLSDEGLLLVGDATGYYDPFTGEGIYRALHGAQLASEVALDALTKNDLSAAMLARYDRLYRETFKGKRLVEMIIQSAVQAPPLMDHLARILGRHKAMADTVVAVTGDFLPPSAVLRPGYLLRLIV
jgi:flavin-dependent dehydrogenase